MKTLNSLKKSFLYSLIILELVIITKINAQDQWEQSLLPRGRRTTAGNVNSKFKIPNSNS